MARHGRKGGICRRLFVLARALLMWPITLIKEQVFRGAKALQIWPQTLIKSRVFLVAKVLLRWLLTLLVAAGFISRHDLSPHIVATIMMCLAFSWIDSILVALVKVPSPFTGYRKFRRFVLCIPEFSLWCSCTKILLVGLVVTRLFHRATVGVFAWAYMISIFAWLYVLSFMSSLASYI